MAVLAVMPFGALRAQILVSDTIATSAEQAGAFNSTLSGTSVENFANMSAGTYNNVGWSGVGTIDKLSLVNDNQYGGVPGTSTYAVESASGSLGGVKNTTISLNQSSSYFGLYWSAGDANNTLSFYNGNTLVGQFTTQSLMDKLPASYYGNPNTPNLNQDRGEPFGFVNFTALNGTSWDKIVLTDTQSSGFESDNWTTRVNGWNPVTDGSLGTTFVSLVDGGTTSAITGVSTNGGSITITSKDSTGVSTTASFAAAAPGAPAPSLTACLAFAGVLLLQTLRRKTAA